MTTQDITTRVTAALAELAAPADGKDPADAVADRLRALEIKGWRGSESMCPVAVYLARINPSWSAEVFETEVWIIDGDGLADAFSVDLPEPIGSFVRRFDQGVYLDLSDGQVA